MGVPRPEECKPQVREVNGIDIADTVAELAESLEDVGVGASELTDAIIQQLNAYKYQLTKISITAADGTVTEQVKKIRLPDNVARAKMIEALLRVHKRPTTEKKKSKGNGGYEALRARLHEQKIDSTKDEAVPDHEIVDAEVTH